MLNKLAYVVIREELDGPILQSQVIDVLNNISQEESEQISLIWFFRIDYLFRGVKSIGDLRADLHAKGIKLIAIPFISLGFPVSWWLLPFVMPQWLVGLLWVYLVKKKQMFHCRSYHSALAGACLKFFFPVKLIFDPRSPFPEENIAARRWKAGGINYRSWKKIEKLLCQKSDVVIAISNPFLESLKEVAPSSRFELIPNNYPSKFTKGTKDVKVIGREGESSENIKICYVGSFGHWNSPEPYLQFLEYLVADSRSSVGAKFIIQSQSLSFLEACLSKVKFNHEKLTVISSSQEDVIDHMSDCVVGIQIMSRPDDRLSIKFVEYLAAGLPVIVSENVRGAADIVKNYKVGFVLNDDFSNKHEALQFISNVVNDRMFWRTKCRNLAEELFSCDVVSKKLKRLYETV